MRIRLATPEDVPALQRMGLAFVAGTPYAEIFDITEASLERLAAFIFAAGPDVAAILLAEDDAGVFGMLALAAVPAVLSGQIYADEIVWWVDPSHRGAQRAGPELLRSAQDWAREHGCYMIKMVAPSGSTVGTFYERLGFSPLETAFTMVL